MIIKIRQKLRIREVDGFLIINSNKQKIIKFCQKETYSRFSREIDLGTQKDLFNVKYGYYHKFYYPNIQYKKFEDLYPSRKFKYIFENKGRLYRYFMFSYNNQFKNSLYNIIDTFLTKTHNRLIWKPCNFLIFEYLENDKRNKEVMDYVKQKYDTSFVNGTALKSKVKNFFNSQHIYILRHKHAVNSNYCRYVVEQNKVFNKQCLYYSRLLKNKAYTFIGVDDPCIINSFLAAVNKFGRSIGVQHGYYSKYNVGYDVNLSHGWFKDLIVWSNVDKKLAENFLGIGRATNLHVGANFFLPNGYLSHDKRSKTAFLVGEENTDYVTQQKLVDVLVEADFQVLTLLKDRTKGTDDRILYLNSLKELQKYAVSVIIGRKSSLVLKFLNQGIPTFVLRDDEGYLSDLAHEYGLRVVDDPCSVLTYAKVSQQRLTGAVERFETILEQIINNGE